MPFSSVVLKFPERSCASWNLHFKPPWRCFIAKPINDTQNAFSRLQRCPVHLFCHIAKSIASQKREFGNPQFLVSFPVVNPVLPFTLWFDICLFCVLSHAGGALLLKRTTNHETCFHAFIVALFACFAVLTSMKVIEIRFLLYPGVYKGIRPLIRSLPAQPDLLYSGVWGLAPILRAASGSRQAGRRSPRLGAPRLSETAWKIDCSKKLLTGWLRFSFFTGRYKGIFLLYRYMWYTDSTVWKYTDSTVFGTPIARLRRKVHR